ncbi:hypothetical protein ABPG75_005513 [Micractinium tetrahymenae]
MIGALLQWLRPKRAPSGSPFGLLPDELVCAILGRPELDQRDRLQSCALVCRRWRHLANSPDVLRQAPITLHIRFSFTAWQALPHPRHVPPLDSLHSWLGRHAAGLHYLRLTVHAYECPDHRSCNLALVGAFQTMHGQLLACLAAAAGGGTLRQLVVQWASFQPLQLGSCLAGATQLRCLAISTSQQDGLHLTCSSLAGLPALQNLTMAGACARRWSRRVALPPSLTRLVLPQVVDCEDNCLPLQLAGLTALRSLEVYVVEPAEAMTDDEEEDGEGVEEEDGNEEEEGEEEEEVEGGSSSSDDDSGGVSWAGESDVADEEAEQGHRAQPTARTASRMMRRRRRKRGEAAVQACLLQRLR